MTAGYYALSLCTPSLVSLMIMEFFLLRCLSIALLGGLSRPFSSTVFLQYFLVYECCALIHSRKNEKEQRCRGEIESEQKAV